MNNSVILVEVESSYNAMIDIMFHDILSMPNANKHVEDFKCNSRFIEFLKRNKVQKYTFGFLNFIFISSYKLRQAIEIYSKQYETIYVFFTNSSFLGAQYPYNVLQFYREHFKNIKYILFYIDIISHPVSYHANMLREKGLFDLIYSIEKNDVKKYDMIQWSTPYSVIEDYRRINSTLDIYFCGVDKGREKLLLEILDTCEEHLVNYRIDLISSIEKYHLFEKRKNVTLKSYEDKYWSYTDLLKKSLYSKCILDIVQEGQESLTLRPYEAVCYNRKLLTNNKAILKFTYYNQNFMQYFKHPSEIDWNWVKSDVEVDYKYNNEFSPIILMNDIERRLTT